MKLQSQVFYSFREASDFARNHAPSRVSRISGIDGWQVEFGQTQRQNASPRETAPPPLPQRRVARSRSAGLPHLAQKAPLERRPAAMPAPPALVPCPVCHEDVLEQSIDIHIRNHRDILFQEAKRLHAHLGRKLTVSYEDVVIAYSKAAKLGHPQALSWLKEQQLVPGAHNSIWKMGEVFHCFIVNPGEGMTCPIKKFKKYRG